MTIDNLVELATEHAIRCVEDIELATDRQAHVRATARANEATALLSEFHILLLDGAEAQSSIKITSSQIE